ncbi:MAG: SDR family oxidoreductase [Aureispira sp.]|nr:SDR family oxidoreductase [Aureispira sp.]
MKRFKDKVVVITGAGSGIGQQLALEFAQAGAKLALNDYNKEGLEETVKLLGTSATVFKEVFDVSKKEAVYGFAEAVMEHYGRVDVVINNAGVLILGKRADEISIEDYEWIMGINVWGVMYGSLAFLPHLRKQKESSLVNISSLFGLIGVPNQAPYCTTKFAVRGFSESMYLEEQINNTGVTVSCVHPGGFSTNIAKSARGNTAELMEQAGKELKGSPNKAARLIIKGIQKKKSRILVGADARGIHTANQVARPLLQRLIKRYVKKD